MWKVFDNKPTISRSSHETCLLLMSLSFHQRKVLEGLEANWYMDKPGRARGLRCSFPSFTQAETESSARAKTKAMILTVRAGFIR